MPRRIRSNQRTRLRISGRLVFVTAFLTTTALLMGGWLVYMNLAEWQNSRAAGNGTGSGGSATPRGEVLCEYSWEAAPGKATIGPDAVSVSKWAVIRPGGKANTKGLSAGSKAKDINLVIPATPAFDVDGIDISIDFRMLEPSGTLFSRSRSLEFWIDRGYPAVLYKTYDVNGGYAMVNERSAYEIPDDGLFRTYRFIYSPVTGRGEIFVNGVIVWSHQGEANAALYWKDAGPMIIGKALNGGGFDEPILDNLVIRSNGSVVPPAESLIGFILDTKPNGVELNWTVTESNHAHSFIIEKSVNAIDFIKIGEVEAHDASQAPDYSYFDKTSQVNGTYYYRLKQVLSSGKFVNHQASAIRMKSNSELTIENIDLSEAAAMNVSYFIPEGGRVSIEIVDETGRTIRNESFTAAGGSNKSVVHHLESLGKGTYTVNLIFNDKKVSRKMIKG
jgi:hypothetical protein